MITQVISNTSDSTKILDKEMYDDVWRVYGGGDKAATYRFARLLLPRRLQDPTHYGMVFEIMVYCLATSNSNPKQVLDEISKIVIEERQLNGESYWLHNALGCLALYQDKFDKNAFVHFALGSAKHRGFDKVYHISSGMDAMRPLDFDPSAYAPRSLSGGLNLDRVAADSSIVHVVAVDPVYFKKYFQRILDQVSKWRDRGVALHIHVVNAGEEELSRLYEAGQELSWLGYSHDETAFPDGLRLRTRMAYFASARYIFAPDILAAYGCPVLITDIDIEIGQNYNDILDVAASNSAAFSVGVASLQNYYAWIRCSAQLSIFQNSKKGSQIARYVSNYILSTFDLSPGAHNWLVDQIALWHAYENFPGQVAHTRLSALGIPKK